MEIEILGQKYKVIRKTEGEYPKLKHMDASGLAELYSKELVINANCIEKDECTHENLEEYENKVIRHEIMHAYFHESGATAYCQDEFLVEWLALQLPKIAKTLIDNNLA